MRTRSTHSASEDMKGGKDEEPLKSTDLKNTKLEGNVVDHSFSNPMSRSADQSHAAENPKVSELLEAKANVDEAIPSFVNEGSLFDEILFCMK